MMSNLETMRILQSLQDDRSMQNILKDKDLMSSINQQDLGRIEQDPKIRQLILNEEFQQILQNIH